MCTLIKIKKIPSFNFTNMFFKRLILIANYPFYFKDFSEGVPVIEHFYYDCEINIPDNPISPIVNITADTNYNLVATCNNLVNFCPTNIYFNITLDDGSVTLSNFAVSNSTIFKSTSIINNHLEIKFALKSLSYNIY